MIVMSNIWLKIAAAVVLIVVFIVIGSKIFNKPSTPPKPVEPEKTISDTWRDDEKRLRAEPNVVEPNAAESNAPIQSEAGQQRRVTEPMKFKELTEDEKAGAEQLFELAMAQRKMGRLPGVSYGAMVQYCRDIIQRYPQSDYAYKAKRMLADIPERERQRYSITDDEMNPNK
jgi:hypothetical protein